MRGTMKVARFAALAGLIVTAACDDLTGLNENKNSPEDVGPEFLLPQAIRSGATSSFGATLMLSHTGIWTGHVVQIQYPDEETGLVRPENMNAFWQAYYTGPLADIQNVVLKGQAANAPNQEGVGLIWRSWLFHQVTDLWGDVPYTQALGGRDQTRPAYDEQEDIYKGLIADLAAGVGKLNPSGGATPVAGGFGSGDILYNNDWEKWARFGNSLRMRLAMRMVNKDANAARTAFIAAYNAGGFQSNADNAAVRWPGAPHENPLHVNWQGRDDHGISAALLDRLVAMSDPRLELYAEPATFDDTYRGWRNGHRTLQTGTALNHYSRIGRLWREEGATTPSFVMTYAEVLFLQAEAVVRGWIPGNAAELYRQGIIAAMTQYGAVTNAPTQVEIDAYLARPEVQYNPATGLQQIHLQLWIALFMNENEAFAHQRRTGVPTLTPGPDLIISRTPVRFQYAPNEQSFNAANLSAAIQRQGVAAGGDLVTSVWFMP